MKRLLTALLLVCCSNFVSSSPNALVQSDQFDFRQVQQTADPSDILQHRDIIREFAKKSADQLKQEWSDTEWPSAALQYVGQIVPFLRIWRLHNAIKGPHVGSLLPGTNLDEQVGHLWRGGASEGKAKLSAALNVLAATNTIDAIRLADAVTSYTSLDETLLNASLIFDFLILFLLYALARRLLRYTLKRIFYISMAALIVGGALLQLAIMGSPDFSTTTALMNLSAINSVISGVVALVSGAILFTRWLRTKITQDNLREIGGRKARDVEAGNTYPSDRWRVLVEYDDDIRAAAEKLHPYGQAWVDKLRDVFFALDQDRQYLPNIVARLTKEAEEAEAKRAIEPFRYTADGQACTEASLAVLREAKAQGFLLNVGGRGAFTLRKGSSVTYLYSNADIERYGLTMRRFLSRESHDGN